MPRLEPDVAPAARAVLPGRAGRDGGQRDHEPGLLDRVLVERDGGQRGLEAAGAAQLKGVGAGVVVVDAVRDAVDVLRGHVYLQRVEAARGRERPRVLPYALVAAHLARAHSGVQERAGEREGTVV